MGPYIYLGQVCGAVKRREKKNVERVIDVLSEIIYFLKNKKKEVWI